MKMILGLTEPTKGEIRVFDTSLEEHMEEILPRIGALIETPPLYGNVIGVAYLIEISQRYPESSSVSGKESSPSSLSR